MANFAGGVCNSHGGGSFSTGGGSFSTGGGVNMHDLEYLNM